MYEEPSKFSVNDKVKVVKPFPKGNIVVGDVGIVTRFSTSSGRAEVKFNRLKSDGGVQNWFESDDYFQLVPPEGHHVETLVGKWVHRTAATSDGRFGWKSEPCLILRIDEQGIAIWDKNDEKGIMNWTKEKPYYLSEPIWFDSNWEEWVEPGELAKFPVGTKVYIVGSAREKGACRSDGSQVGVVTALENNNGWLAGRKGGINVDLGNGKIVRVNESAVVACDPRREEQLNLWKQSLERYLAVKQALANLKSALDGGGSIALGVPSCGFCEHKSRVNGLCSDCGWKRVFGDCHSSDSSWSRLVSSLGVTGEPGQMLCNILNGIKEQINN